MKVAVGQFAVSKDWQENVQTCIGLMERAKNAGAHLLVLPEAVLARDDNDPDLSVKSAQTVNEAFIAPLCEQSRHDQMTTILTLHIKTTPGRAANTLLAIRDGEVIARYQKLHLYDAFNVQESRLVDAGESMPPLIDVAGFKVGLMTCYDVRFPEMALSLALAGADVLVLPAAWLRGPNKEMHWATLLAARALDTTSYVVAAGECGNKNIGHSQVVDPLGVVVAAANQRPALIYAELESQHLADVRAMLPVLKNRRFASPQLL
ncbi:deaminated glutathione amidase [Buttiauxella selenatireducens]|uniref:Deaminated glutathione amidase n=1 Tax=Buttiauxella selenatireducens TaxID=3073902 RepID=A0ABY9S872_9ENTR|nr:deaminated glutathione amidase [Buttiauxella sp. R73]WMY73295.1 deaminated glutathione amidase [Buttiauxella sp. R73]